MNKQLLEHPTTCMSLTRCTCPLFPPADNFLQVKEVLFNGTEADWTPIDNTKNSLWVSVPVYKKLSDFDVMYPVDITIVVRGKVCG